MKPLDKPWMRTPLDPKAARIPAMLTDEERRYLTWVTTHHYQGWGAIVDLGPWIGASSAALATGLRERKIDKKVHCFDIFEWCRIYMEDSLPENLPDGADFRYVFDRETASFARWLAPQRMDLERAEWHGGDIEILFVDAAKSWQLADAILRVFGPHLVPGRSRVIHQDFAHFYTYWLPLMIDSRPDIWQESEAVDDGTTVAFVPQRPVFGKDGMREVHRDSDFSLEDAVRIFDARQAGASPQNRGRYRLGLLRKALHGGAIDLVHEIRREVEALDGSLMARKELPQALERGCGDLVREGDLLRMQGRPKEGLVLGERCLALDPRHWGARYLVATSLVDLGDVGRAETMFSDVVAECPARGEFAVDKRHPLCRLYLADLRLRHAAVQGVPELVLAALALLDPGDTDLLRWGFGMLERTLSASGVAQTVLAALTRLEGKMGGNPDFQVARAVACRAAGSHAAARDALAKALTIDPQHDHARRLAVEVA